MRSIEAGSRGARSGIVSTVRSVGRLRQLSDGLGGGGVGGLFAGGAEGDGPPVELGEHARHLGGAAVGLGWAAVGVEELPGVLETDGVADRHDVQFREDLTELLDGAESAGDTAVGDEGDWLGVPLLTGGIDQFF